MAKVAVAQMLSGEDLSANLQQVEQLIYAAAAENAALVLLPENLAFLDSKALISMAQEDKKTQRIYNFLANLSCKFKLWIIAGSVPVLDDMGERVYARCMVFNDQGHLVDYYDKMHLFDVDVADGHCAYRESDFIRPGYNCVVTNTVLGRVGLSICYDLRFPEMYQKLRFLGAEIITVPSAFTQVTGAAHWEVLLRARAIETQCYILAANQGGEHSATRKSYGHSMIVDPWGEILAQRTEPGPGLIYADLNLTEVAERRQAMPIIQHRNKVGF